MSTDNWLVAQGDIDGLPAIVRLRDEVQSFIKGGKHQHYLRVVWEMSEIDEFGLPDENEMQRLELFEDRLCSVFEAGDHAILSFVLTNDGLRQWLFYSQDLEESVRRINEMPQEEAAYPIELTANEDPEWSEYGLVAESFGEREA